MIGVATAALFLLAAPLHAARYDPAADRAALRQAATSCHATIVDASGLALETEKVPAIVKGLDEGLRLAQAAAAAARALDAAAHARAKEMTAGTDSLDARLNKLTDPLATERRRADKGAAELSEFKNRIEKLPEEERKKFAPRVAKAAAALTSGSEALRPAEAALRGMSQRALEMKAALRQLDKPLDEVSAASSATIAGADGLTGPAAQVKERLAALNEPPLEASRARAQEKIGLLRGASLLLFQAADRACNRADDIRRVSAAYDDAAIAFEKAEPVASPAEAMPLLDAAEKALTQIRELLKHSL